MRTVLVLAAVSLCACRSKPPSVALTPVVGAPVSIVSVSAQPSTVYGLGSGPIHATGSDEKNTVSFNATTSSAALPPGMSVGGKVSCAVKGVVIATSYIWSTTMDSKGNPTNSVSFNLPPNTLGALPSACEASFQYGKSIIDATPPPAPIALGTVCYVTDTKSLTVGPCPAPLIERKVEAGVKVKMRELKGELTTASGGHQVSVSYLAAPQQALPADARLAVKAKCLRGNVVEEFALNTALVHFQGLVPGEHTSGLATSQPKPNAFKACEVNFALHESAEGEAIPVLTTCVTQAGLEEAPCRFPSDAVPAVPPAQ
ncbi:MAG: hypothetical protein K1X89_02425 [Myxococcaceae bacterium]|nr:hypothetical protein [Myxococcaceae bacterium]